VKGKQRVENELKGELNRLQRMTGMGRELRVRYIAGGSTKLEGEVVDRTILIYGGEEPIEILRHEFLDYIICQAIEPYAEIANFQRDALNALLKEMEGRAYRRKEEVVEALLKSTRMN